MAQKKLQKDLGTKLLISIKMEDHGPGDPIG